MWISPTNDEKCGTLLVSLLFAWARSRVSGDFRRLNTLYHCDEHVQGEVIFTQRGYYISNALYLLSSVFTAMTCNMFNTALTLFYSVLSKTYFELYVFFHNIHSSRFKSKPGQSHDCQHDWHRCQWHNCGEYGKCAYRYRQIPIITWLVWLSLWWFLQCMKNHA